MTKKQRKTLDDALAEQFVYGEGEPKDGATAPPAAPPPVKENPPPTSPSQPSKESSLMEKLQLEPKEVTKRFTVDLPETMHRKLSILSAKTGRTKADIVRMLLEETLKDVEG
jgi:heme-binding NEAT domain protein